MAKRFTMLLETCSFVSLAESYRGSKTSVCESGVLGAGRGCGELAHIAFDIPRAKFGDVSWTRRNT